MLFTLALIISLHVTVANAGDSIKSDGEALLEFKKGFANSSSMVSWNESGFANSSNIPVEVCKRWAGVTCSNLNGTDGGPTNASRVIELNLSNYTLQGAIPNSSVGSLAELQVLNLTSNFLSGLLPPDLANCRNLATLDLGSNAFSTALTDDPLYLSNISLNWPNLTTLDLSSNHFNGSIPSSFADLSRLETLLLDNNSLSGEIPDKFKSPPLRAFNVSFNDLQGSIPGSLANFTNRSFIGNPKLCGSPLPLKCPAAPPPSPSPDSPAPSPSSGSDENSRSKTLSAGMIAGVTISAVAALLVLCTLAPLIMMRMRMSRRAACNEPLYGDCGSWSEMDSKDLLRASHTRSVSSSWGLAASTSAGSAPAPKELVFMNANGQGRRIHKLKLMDVLAGSAALLGKGSVGMTYKVTMEDGLTLAIKRLNGLVHIADGRDYEPELTRKMEDLGALPHPHLLPYLAYFIDCHNENSPSFLVTDYMPNMSLFHLLHGSRDVPVGWEMRRRIALATAEALEYLHAHNVVHGNVKSSNVLIDREGDVRVADYGLAQLVIFYPVAKRTMQTYLAPEPTTPTGPHPEAADLPSDVYSFGVLLLELITGKPPMSFTMTTDEPLNDNADALALDVAQGVSLHTWAASVDEERWASEVFDPKAMGSEDNKKQIELEMARLLKIALSCLIRQIGRPTMAEVFKQIKGI